MVCSCCVPGCKLSWYPDAVSFHKFPKDPVLSKTWRKVIGNDNVPKDALVCSIHFHSDDFKYIREKNVLKETAVPKFFLPSISSASASFEGTNTRCTVDEYGESTDEQKTFQIELQPVLSADQEISFTQNGLLLPVTSNVQAPELKTIDDYEGEVQISAVQFQPLSFAEHEYQKALNRKNQAIVLMRYDEEEDSEPVINDIGSENLVFEISPLDVNKECMINSNPSPPKDLSLKKRLNKLRKKFKLLRQNLQHTKKRNESLLRTVKFIREYTKNTEIDNILHGNFEKLCEMFSNRRRDGDDEIFSDDALKFALSMYVFSPEAYDYLKQYMHLPDKVKLQSLVSSGTYIFELAD